MYTRISIYAFSIIVAALFALAPSAYADTLVQHQDTFNTQSGVSNSSLQRLGTGLTGYSSSLSMKFYVKTFSSGGTDFYRTRITCYDDAARSASTGSCLNANGSNVWQSATSSVSISALNQVVDVLGLNITDRSVDAYGVVPLHFDSSKYYFAQYEYAGGTATYTNGSLGFAGSFVPACEANCGALGAAYYQFYSDVSFIVSEIHDVTSPTPFQVTPTSAPQLTFTYTDADSYNVSGGRLRDLTSGADMVVPEETRFANGTFTYDETLHLYPNHFYSVVPYIRSTVTGQQIQGPLISFSTVTAANINLAAVATTTFGAVSNCVFGGPYFDVAGCAGYWFLPDATTTSQVYAGASMQFKNNGVTANAFRFGDEYLAAAAASSTYATSTLPSLNIHLPTWLATQGQIVNLTPWDELLGPTSMLSQATNPDTGDNLRTIVEPGWRAFVWFIFVIACASELFGFGIRNLDAKTERHL